MIGALLAVLLATTPRGLVELECPKVGPASSVRIAAWYFEDLATTGWSLDLEGDGTLRVSTSGGETSHKVSKPRMEDLRQAVRNQKPWTLRQVIGTPNHLSFAALAVCEGQRKAQLTFYGLAGQESTSEDEARFLSIWVAVRSLFDSPLAADGEYLRKALTWPRAK